MQKLWATVHLPLAQNLERLTVEHENAAWPIAIRRTQRANINPFRSTVDRVKTGIISTRKNFLRLDHFDDLGFSRLGLYVDDVNTRRADPGHNQVASFNVRVR